MASSHLKALMKKNWIIWKRDCCCSCLEILVPVFMAFLFAGLRASSPVKEIDTQSYYSQPTPFSQTISVASLPLLKQCGKSENGGAVALAPSGNPIITSLDTQLQGISYQKSNL